jgi:hypothetical protein
LCPPDRQALTTIFRRFCSTHQFFDSDMRIEIFWPGGGIKIETVQRIESQKLFRRPPSLIPTGTSLYSTRMARCVSANAPRCFICGSFRDFLMFITLGSPLEADGSFGRLGVFIGCDWKIARPSILFQTRHNPCKIPYLLLNREK